MTKRDGGQVDVLAGGIPVFGSSPTAPLPTCYLPRRAGFRRTQRGVSRAAAGGSKQPPGPTASTGLLVGKTTAGVPYRLCFPQEHGGASAVVAASTMRTWTRSAAVNHTRIPPAGPFMMRKAPSG
jgi:hypothetical protein